jgi:hypothetical protein
MAQKKKLQVFVSSTYIDLQEERQAAVQAILTAGHIPAGMELFAAGDETQMNVIKRWIDESDIFMLILGGRYGSIERNSGKSYIQLEYEYALKKGKPLFAVVISKDCLEEKVKKNGTQVIELDNPDKLREFRGLVRSKMVRFWSDAKDIKLSILETLADFSRRSDLIGWIPGSESVDTGALAEEIVRLTKENAELRESVSKGLAQSTKYSGLTYDEMVALLSRRNLLKLLLKSRAKLLSGMPYKMASSVGEESIMILAEIGLLDLGRNQVGNDEASLSDVGKQFLARYYASNPNSDLDSDPDSDSDDLSWLNQL